MTSLKPPGVEKKPSAEFALTALNPNFCCAKLMGFLAFGTLFFSSGCLSRSEELGGTAEEITGAMARADAEEKRSLFSTSGSTNVVFISFLFFCCDFRCCCCCFASNRFLLNSSSLAVGCLSFIEFKEAPIRKKPFRLEAKRFEFFKSFNRCFPREVWST